MNSSPSSTSSSSSSSNSSIPVNRNVVHKDSMIREGSFLANKDEASRKAAEVDLSEMIEKSKCAIPYHDLEECLGEYDRDWRKCQIQVKALRRCWEEDKK
eukprot:gene15476-17323_t